VGEVHIVPQILTELRSAHSHNCAVQRPYRGARYGIIFEAVLGQRLDSACLIGSLGAASLKGNGIGFGKIELKLQSSTSVVWMCKKP
jgi:hypothetical protein